MSFFKKITDSVSKGVTTATEKAQQTVEITKLNNQISGKRKDIDKLYAAIGEAVYDAHLANDLSTAEALVTPKCEEITAIREEIAVLDARIKAIRNEKDCEACGKRVPEDTRFCPSCGYAFPAPVVEKEPIQVDLHVPEESEEESGARQEADGAIEAEQAEAESARVDLRQICNSCGTPLYADSHFCPACGQSTRA
ncbi:zinc-ribbon domain-containing protein [Cohnella cellulosilytica]|uniref:Zinc-ribbon domain-containing protein n=1 Tax=Cohnella cellulosilytica TaxID=986710 RepID=A0ABW2F6D7_9BACL